MNKIVDASASAAAILVACASLSASPVADTLVSLKKTPSDKDLLVNLARASVGEKDEGTKARGLAICHLGFLLLRQPDMSQKAKTILLHDCAMSEYASVISTNSFTSVSDCAECQGRGGSTATCADCSGVVPAGYSWWSTQHVVRSATGGSRPATACASCKGVGDKPGVGAHRVPCIKCKGQKVCPTCAGTGQVMSPCKTCKEGKISSFDAESARTLYLLWLNQDDTRQPAIPAP